MFKCVLSSFVKKNQYKPQDLKVMRWLINERRDSISPLFTNAEFNEIMQRVNEDFMKKLTPYYPKEKDRIKIAVKINDEVSEGINKIYKKVDEKGSNVSTYNLNKVAEMILPFALLRDDAEKELETYMDNIIKDGRTVLTQAEFEKYQELKKKVDELEQMRIDKVEELNLKKKANYDILKQHGIQEEHSFLFDAEPVSEDFLKTYFPSLKLEK